MCHKRWQQTPSCECFPCLWDLCSWWLIAKTTRAADVKHKGKSLDCSSLFRQRREAVAAFYNADGPPALTWFYQIPAGRLADGPPQLYLGSPQASPSNAYPFCDASWLLKP